MATENEQLLQSLGIKGVNPDALPLVTTVDEAALTKQQVLADSRSSTFLNSLGSAVEEEWIATSVYNNLDRFQSSGTPVSKFTPDLVKQLTEGLEDTLAAREVLEDAQLRGVNSAMKTRESYLRTQANRRQIAEDGWSGVTATALAAMFDPVEWAAIFGTTAAATAMAGPVGGGAALVAGTAKKAYNVGRAFKYGAVIGGAETAAFEAIRANLKYDVTASDVVIAGGLGATLAGGLNAGATAFVRAGHRARIAQKVLRGETLTPAEQRFHDEYNVDALADKILRSELDGEKFIEAADGLPTQQKSIAVGEVTEEMAEAIPEQAGWNMLGLRKLLSTGYRLGSHRLGYARYAARVLGLNSSGYKGGKLETGMSASEWSEMYQARFRSTMSNVMPNAQARWKQRTGGTISDFNTLVSRYVRGIDTEVPNEVKEVGDLVNKLQRELAEEAVKHDVAGFSMDMLNNHSNYMTRIFNDEKIRALRMRLGDEADLQIAELVETAIRKGQPDIVANVRKHLASKGKKKVTNKMVKDYIRKIATAYTKSITDPKLGKLGHAGANEMNLEDLADILKAGGFDAEDIDIVTDFLTRTNIPKAHKRARHRLILSEDAVIKVQDSDGNVFELKFADLLEEDAEQLFNSYVFQMSGAIGLARNGINTNQVNSGFENLLENIRKEGKKKNASKDEIDEAINAAQFMYDGITGRLAHRQEVSNRTRDFFIATRAFSFAINMGMSGMSALMEISNAMFEYSFRTILKSSPAYRSLIGKAKQGRLPDDIMRELVEAFGLGEEVALGNWTNVTRYDTEDVGDTISPERAWVDKKGWSARLARGTEQFAFTAQKNVAYWSGLTGVTQTLRRLSMLNYTNEWVLAAQKGNLPFSVTKRQQLGLSEEMAGRISAIMRSNIVEKEANGAVKKLNLKDWPDDVRDAFQASGFKEARNNVQESNISSTNPWLRGEVGKTFFQFMNFTVASLEQQTMRLGVRMRRGDMAVTKVLLSAAMMGSLMYIARVNLNAAGRSDADEYVRDMMEGDKIILGALNQIGASSMLMYIYQLTTSAMSGNTYAITPPAFSLAQSAFQTVDAIAQDDWSESDWRTFLRIAPYQSLYGARQGLNAVANYFGN